MGNDGTNATPRLYEALGSSFDIGAAVSPRTLLQSGEFIARHYNSLTAENEMKFVNLQPVEDHYTFEDADRIVAFAKTHGKKLRGHTLVWHNQTSDWLFKESDGRPVCREKLLDRLQSHIKTVVGRYKDAIYAWDVVNEVIADEGPELLRPSKWLDIAGPDFIAKAFEFAHAADPAAQLFYNDYNESNPHKRDKIYRLVKSLLEQGAPVHGVGLQAHWNVYSPSLDEIREAIEKYAMLGLRLQLTELDVSLFRHEDERTDLTSPPEELLELQAKRYEAIFLLLKEYQVHIDAVTFWGADDNYTWLSNFPVRGRKNWPLLFDEQHQPKEAFWRVIGKPTQL
ncbi:endo-1,4-beta-xylanase [Paenibacillus sinopodophylli]|uniref:endo-1,4-beta-xylanase n=1 Tax=Paenibacillus sinopodophylli TaxID=1837342 RepID=UPI00110C97CF|nr:endo-1,4-beta-xylanase [Paenibacillus sinopodophylli]